MIAPVTGKAFAVLFQDLAKWDHLSLSLARFSHVRTPLVPVSKLFTVRKEVVPKTAFDSGEVRMVDKVSFDGEVVMGRDRTRMTQYLAEPGDLIVSKIRARQGSVGLLKQGQGKASVTIHYRVLVPGPRIIPEYAWLAFRSRYVRNQFLAATGGAMKGEISEAKLLDIELPCPDTNTQQAILDSWQAALTAAANSRAEASATEAHLQETLLDDLGLSLPEQKVASRAFAVDWDALSRWGVGVTRETLNRPTFDGAKYPLACLGDVIADLENGWSPKCENRPAKADEWGVLKLGAVSFGVFNPNENKALPKGLVPRPAYELKPGDLLISRANITRLVGACALVEASRPRLMLCDKILRAVWRDDATVDKRFLVEVLKIPHVRWQIEHNVTGASPTMKNITKPNLLALRFPLPPIEKQTDIARKLQALREEGYRLAADAKRMEAQARAEIEAMILGTKPVPKTGRKR